MSKEAVFSQMQPEATESSPIKLWTPRAVGLTTVFIGLPAGLVLLCVNRYRLGLKRQARNLMLAGSAGLLAYPIVYLFLPGDAKEWIAWLANAAVAVFLWKKAESEQREFEAANGLFSDANWFMGVLIGLTITAAYIVLYICLGTIVYYLAGQLLVPILE